MRHSASRGGAARALADKWPGSLILSNAYSRGQASTSARDSTPKLARLGDTESAVKIAYRAICSLSNGHRASCFVLDTRPLCRALPLSALCPGRFAFLIKLFHWPLQGEIGLFVCGTGHLFFARP